MKKKITILEKIHKDGENLLRRHFDVNEKLGLQGQELIDQIQNTPIIIVKSVTQINKYVLESCPNLKIIARAGTGLDNIKVDHANALGKKVLFVPTGNTVSAAEFAITQILTLCKRVPEILNSIQKQDYRRHLLEGREIRSLNIGIFGLGNVGIEVARRLNAFGCKIFAYDPFTSHREEFEEMNGIFVNDINDFLPQLDVLSLHLSLNEKTKGIINKNVFKLLKKGCILVNTARGGVINDSEVLEYINNGTITSFATDVLCPEPPFDLAPGEHNFTHPLLGHPKIFVTPHIAASTLEAQSLISIDLAKQIIEHSKDF